MTQQEEKSLANLNKLLSDIREENRKFREDVTNQISSINSKTDKKHQPIFFEQDILKVAQTSINESIGKVMTGYDSPLTKLVKSVVDENSVFLREIISDSFSQVIKTDDFKQSIVNAFSHKVARSIISNNDGLFDKVANELKQDTVFKSKMSIAVGNVVEECLNIKANK